MPIITPHIPSPQEQHQEGLWLRDECYKFYVQQRRLNCNFLQLMDLTLQVPYCITCALSDPFGVTRPPDIDPANWGEDIIWELGEDALIRVITQLLKEPDFAYHCYRCGSLLRPWEDDELYVFSRHLEEDYSIPLETGHRKNPSKQIRKKIIELYNGECFECGSTDSKLQIDHILPRSKGGDSAFRNLQPLCQTCGQLKSNKLPEEVIVFCDIHFGPYPSDSYEGLFWSVDETL